MKVQKYSVHSNDINHNPGWQVWDDGDPKNHRIVGPVYRDKATADRQCQRLNQCCTEPPATTPR
jgi:hypothetical protein